jgi:hypothetical protein
MDKNIISNPNDFKVVEFHNSTDFDFTPELGAMYDGRALFVSSGERRQFPYHVGNRLAINLAKVVLLKGAPAHDPKDLNPVGHSLWSEERLNALKNSFLTVLYQEEKPIAMSETDRLMARVAELEKNFKKEPAESAKTDAPVNTGSETVSPKMYVDKSEVIAELEKRGIAHDKRQSKANLEKLIV